ncbi:T9SS C-terminal target domain-containing protein [Chryseobacterium nematophagum]|uniref:T9SS C-terminal target domain-containing protein n=1 Tax=Chryseobacterium nematophagum TaxID=2305228 RepID=A0A3M7TEV8_9FLAO|nr:T9SS type A sorting domain-containing protein [Chryseobacterium nematophagum]RNA61417.1 T9SS C-terminal target domain-containing protein [Chryseobacterium nematophagum]
MRNLNFILTKLVILLIFLSAQIKAQTYTSVYNGINYSSPNPYNLNVVYFVANDVILDPTYKIRLSALLLWGQNFYKQNMISNGYGPKTFNLFTEGSNPNNVKIIVIHGSKPLSGYPYNNFNPMLNDINEYFANNPEQKNSQHMLVIAAIPDQATASVPFYGIGKTCFALDYPQFDIQYLGTNTHEFTKWFGGMMHELGHGLNLPHSKQTNTENSNPNQGMNLMSAGNYTLGLSPTFINRAGSAILSNCEVFANATGTIYYNGHIAGLTSLNTTFNNNILTVSGEFQSNKPVTDINIYQDPHPEPHTVGGEAYDRKAWSVPPSGNYFSVSMPVNELELINGKYNLQIELVLENGETTFDYYPFTYTNGVPNININFGNLSLSEIESPYNNIIVYPNPVADDLNIILGAVKNNYNIEITNTLGQLIYKTLTSEKFIKISLSNQPSGIYIVKIKSSNNANKTYRIIKK